MGSMYKRGDTYYIDFRIGGRRIRKKIGKSKQLAELALKDAEVKAARNEAGFIEKDKPIDEFLKEFLEYSTTNHTPSTFTRYKAIVDHFNFFLKDYPHITKLSHLNPGLFEKYKTSRRQAIITKNGQPITLTENTELPPNAQRGAKTNTINMEITTLRTMLNLAIKWDYLNKNPTQDIKKLKVTDAKPPRFLTKEECKLLLENCGDELYPIFYTFIHTGMREAELVNLEWEDIDFVRRKIRIRRKDFWHPKTGERDIPIGKNLMEVLENLKQKSKAKGFVFSNNNGDKLKRRLRRDLMGITKKCGFPDVTKLHSLRHTFASHLVMKGVDLPTIQKLMGHADIQTTMIYSHLAPDHLSDAVDKLDI